MKCKTWHALGFLCIAVLAVYYPALSAPYNSVDDVRLVNQLLNRTEFSWRDFVIPGSSSYFRPLINSSFILDRILWGMEAPLLHLENVLLHLTNTLLVFALACQFARVHKLDGLSVPMITALLFGLHPLNVEAVAWVAGRADLLVGTFVLLTLYCFWRYLTEGRKAWLLAAVVSFFLGSLAKETALFVLPGLLLLTMVQPAPLAFSDRPSCRSLSKTLLSLSPFVAVAAGYFLLRGWALQGRDLGLRHVARLATVPEVVSLPQVVFTTPETPSFSLIPLLNKAEQLVGIAGFYAKKLIWPFPLNFGITTVPDGYFWVGLVLLLSAFILLWRRTLAGNLALTAMSLGSIALLVAFGGISWTPIAERYMYVPAAVLSLSCMSVIAGTATSSSSRLLSGIVAILLIVFAAGAFHRCLIWQDNLTLFADTVKKSPDFAMAKNELALALLNKGEQQEAYEILRNLDLPDFQVASLNRAMVFAAEGQLETARSLLLERLQNPGSYETIIHLRLVSVLERLSSSAAHSQQASEYRKEALYYLEKIWERTKNPFYLYRVGQFQLELGDQDKARESFALAAELLPVDSLYKAPARKLAELNQ
jgi:tetratricopeptide (TPR) repeat protein